MRSSLRPPLQPAGGGAYNGVHKVFLEVSPWTTKFPCKRHRPSRRSGSGSLRPAPIPTQTPWKTWGKCSPSVRLFRRLAGRCPTQPLLGQYATACAADLRQVETEYFLLCGAPLPSAGRDQPPLPSALQGLRAVCLLQEKLAETAQTYAQRTETPALQSRFTQIAQDAELRAQGLRPLIARLLV